MNYRNPISQIVAVGADWESENPIPQANPLNGIWGISSNDFYAVGSSGTILHYNGNSFYTKKLMLNLTLSPQLEFIVIFFHG